MIAISDHFTYRKLLLFALPNIIIMIFTSLYTIVDGVFVSNLVGSQAFASLNLIWPPLGIIQTVGFMVGTGGSALVSRLLGEEKKEQASQVFTMLFIFLLILGLAVSLTLFLSLEQVAYLLGADESLISDCLAYGRPLAVLMIFCMLQSFYQSFLVTISKSKYSLAITVLGGCLNLVLDYIFIAFFGMGIGGAAWATGLNWFLGALLSSLFFFHQESLHYCRFHWDLKSIGKACFNGSSEMVTNVSISTVSMLYNFELMKLIGSDGIVAYGILAYISFVFVALYLGYTVAITPIVGFNYGAENGKELHNILIKSLGLISISSLAVFLLAEISAPLQAGIFVSYSSELMELCIHAIRIYSISFLFSGFNIFASSFFTGLNNGLISAVISFCRTFLFQVAAILIMPLFFGLNGIWNAVNVAEISSLFLSFFFLYKDRWRYHYAKPVA